MELDFEARLAMVFIEENESGRLWRRLWLRTSGGNIVEKCRKVGWNLQPQCPPVDVVERVPDLNSDRLHLTLGFVT